LRIEKAMSRASKSKRSSRSSRRGKSEFTPITGAGLIRFFREETGGIAIPPYIVIIIAVILVILVLIFPMILPI